MKSEKGISFILSSFATVYKGINKITKEIVAIKKYNLRKI